jgi:hypothetical protein
VTGFFVFFKFINMTIEQGLLSDDIEIIKLYTKIYLENNTKENLLKILEKNNNISNIKYHKEKNYLFGLKKTSYYTGNYFIIEL